MVESPSYEQYKKWVQDQGIKTQKEFEKFDRSKFPPGYPKSPADFYKRQGTWKGWPDLFGRDPLWSKIDIDNAPSYEEYQKLMLKLKIKTQKEFRKFDRSKFLPGYPKDPEAFYKKQGTWKGWPDLFGTRPWFPRNPPSYEEYQKLMLKLKIKTKDGFMEFIKINELPPDYPKYPDKFYKRQGVWVDWPHLFGTKSFFPRNPPSYDEYSKWAQKQQIKTENGFKEFVKTNELPPDYPIDLETFYKKRKTWKGWGHFLGTGTIATQNRVYLPPIEARIAIKKIAKEVFGGKPFTEQDWEDAHDAGKIPKNIPKHLGNIYDPDVKRRKREYETKRRKKK